MLNSHVHNEKTTEVIVQILVSLHYCVSMWALRVAYINYFSDGQRVATIIPDIKDLRLEAWRPMLETRWPMDRLNG